MAMSHVAIFWAPRRCYLGLCRPVGFKKWPCRPVDFSGQGPYTAAAAAAAARAAGAAAGALDGGSPCRMSILRNANVTCFCRLIFPMSPVEFSNGYVACRYIFGPASLLLKGRTH